MSLSITQNLTVLDNDSHLALSVIEHQVFEKLPSKSVYIHHLSSLHTHMQQNMARGLIPSVCVFILPSFQSFLCAVLSISREEFRRSALYLTHTLIVMPRTHGWPLFHKASIAFSLSSFFRVHRPEQVVINEAMRSNSSVFLSICVQMSEGFSYSTYTLRSKRISFASILYLPRLNHSFWNDQKWSFNQEKESLLSSCAGRAVYLNSILLLFHIHVFIRWNEEKMERLFMRHMVFIIGRRRGITRPAPTLCLSFTLFQFKGALFGWQIFVHSLC